MFSKRQLRGVNEVHLLSKDHMGLVCFSLAVVHTFSVARFRLASERFSKKSWAYMILHGLGELELVFAIWSLVFMSFFFVFEGGMPLFSYLKEISFAEPIFVFVVLTACATRPVMHLASSAVSRVASVIPLSGSLSLYLVTLVLGPLLGSLITEPAAMTVTAMILLERFFDRGISRTLKYATVGLLFVNISIGGTLTHFAAPPVLMVASKWNWGTSFMWQNFGWKGALACWLSTIFVIIRFRKELLALDVRKTRVEKAQVPFWLTAAHLVLMAAVVFSAHAPWVLLGLFFALLTLTRLTSDFQDDLQWREGLLVGLFLAGLVILGPAQRWWLQPLLKQLDSVSLYLGAIGLTAFTDNAALTYLGSQVELSELGRYALVAGSVVGGGLTVIANAPNPAGFGLLNASFGERGISPLGLLLSALGPTLVAALCFWFL